MSISFSGVGGEGAVGASAHPSFDLSKLRATSMKIRAKPGPTLFDLKKWLQRFTEELIKIFFGGHNKKVLRSLRDKICRRKSHKNFSGKSKIILLLYLRHLYFSSAFLFRHTWCLKLLTVFDTSLSVRILCLLLQNCQRNQQFFCLYSGWCATNDYREIQATLHSQNMLLRKSVDFVRDVFFV